MVNKSAEAGTRIQSVSRAMRLLALVASMPESERTAARICEALGTSLPTTYHILNTLVDAQMLVRSEDKRYHLGMAVGVLAAAYYRQTLPPPELLDPLRALNKETGESTYLSAWRHGELELLAKFEGTHAVSVANLEPGFRGAAHARASGKVLLAFANTADCERYLSMHELAPITRNTITDREQLQNELAQVLRRGYATEVEEFAISVGCVSVPIITGDTLIGAFTIAAPIERYHKSRAAYVSALKKAATQVMATSLSTEEGAGAI